MEPLCLQSGPPAVAHRGRVSCCSSEAPAPARAPTRRKVGGNDSFGLCRSQCRSASQGDRRTQCPTHTTATQAPIRSARAKRTCFCEAEWGWGVSEESVSHAPGQVGQVGTGTESFGGSPSRGSQRRATSTLRLQNLLGRVLVERSFRCLPTRLTSPGRTPARLARRRRSPERPARSLAPALAPLRGLS